MRGRNRRRAADHPREEPPRPVVRLAELGRFRSTGRVGEGPQPGLAGIAAHRRTQPDGLRRLIRGDLDWIVMKALEKDRHHRYETVSGLRMDVQRHLADEPVAAGPPSIRYRLRKFVRRNRGAVLSVAAIVLALVGGIIGTSWGLIRATDARAVAGDEAKAKQTALATAQDRLFEALLHRARAGRYGRQRGQRLESLLRPVPSRRHPPRRAAARRGHRRHGPARPPLCPGLVARCARAGLRRAVSALGPRRGPGCHQHPRPSRGPGDPAHRPGPAPGDPRFQPRRPVPDRARPEVHTPRLAHRRRAIGPPRPPPRVPGVCVQPDGRRLAVGHRGWVLCFDLAAGRELRRWRLPGRARTLAFHPDGRKLAVGYSETIAASVYDATSGALLANLPVETMREQFVAWHPDGERLAVAGSDPRIQIWDVAARRRVATLEGHVQFVSALSFHPGGDLVASHGWDGMVLLWHPSSGRQLLAW